MTTSITPPAIQLRLASAPRNILWPSLMGMTLGFVAAWAVHDDQFRPFAHIYVIWIAMLVVLCARKPVLTAVVRAWASLTAAVLFFYIGKSYWYGQYYPGMPYTVNVVVVVQWLVMSIVAAFLLGIICSLIGAHNRFSLLATSAIMGLIAADALRWCLSFPEDAATVTLAALGVMITILWFSIRRSKQIVPILVGSCLFTVAGLLVVLLPDFAEQLLRG